MPAIWGRRFEAGLFALQRVLQTADGVLDLALDLIGHAFGLQLAVADGLAGSFLDLALDLAGRAFDAILVHAILRGETEKRPHSVIVAGLTTYLATYWGTTRLLALMAG